MKILGIIITLMVATLSFAGIPEPVVTYSSVYQGYATIAGKLATTPVGPVGISVENGGLKYATVSDSQGRWGIVIRYLGTTFSVNSFSLVQPSDVSAEISGVVK